jgi:hypothetical protein
MSKVIVYRAFAKDSFPVTAGTIAAGWVAGQCMTLEGQGLFAKVAYFDQALFVAGDNPTELSAPPTGSLVTGYYGTGSKLVIDHTAEVAAGSTVRAYSTTGNPESAALNADLYTNASGQWTTTASGSIKAKLFQIPSAVNNFGLGIILRF